MPLKAVVQRVTSAQVSVDSHTSGAIDAGLLVFLGVASGDTEKDVDWMVKKISNLRVFNDPEGKMNLSAIDLGHSILSISQFTLLGDCRKGNRPNFMSAAHPDEAKRLYETFNHRMSEILHVETGVFAARMTIAAVNDGPVTIILDSSAG